MTNEKLRDDDRDTPPEREGKRDEGGEVVGERGSE